MEQNIKIIVFLAFSLGLLLLIRKVVTWYFKLDKLVEQNDEIIYWLKSLKKHQNDKD